MDEEEEEEMGTIRTAKRSKKSPETAGQEDKNHDEKSEEPPSKNKT